MRQILFKVSVIRGNNHWLQLMAFRLGETYISCIRRGVWVSISLGIMRRRTHHLSWLIGRKLIVEVGSDVSGFQRGNRERESPVSLHWSPPGQLTRCVFGEERSQLLRETKVDSFHLDPWVVILQLCSGCRCESGPSAFLCCCVTFYAAAWWSSTTRNAIGTTSRSDVLQSDLSLISHIWIHAVMECALTGIWRESISVKSFTSSSHSSWLRTPHSEATESRRYRRVWISVSSSSINQPAGSWLNMIL